MKELFLVFQIIATMYWGFPQADRFFAFTMTLNPPEAPQVWLGRFRNMPKFTSRQVPQSALESRSDSTQNLLLKIAFSSIYLYQICMQALRSTPRFRSQLLSFVFQAKAGGGGELILLGLQLFYVWAGNAVDPSPFTSCGSMSEGCTRSCVCVPGSLHPAFKN